MRERERESVYIGVVIVVIVGSRLGPREHVIATCRGVGMGGGVSFFVMGGLCVGREKGDMSRYVCPMLYCTVPADPMDGLRASRGTRFGNSSDLMRVESVAAMVASAAAWASSWER